MIISSDAREENPLRDRMGETLEQARRLHAIWPGKVFPAGITLNFAFPGRKERYKFWIYSSILL